MAKVAKKKDEKKFPKKDEKKVDRKKDEKLEKGKKPFPFKPFGKK